MDESVLSKNILNEKLSKYKFPLHILASEDTQEIISTLHIKII